MAADGEATGVSATTPPTPVVLTRRPHRTGPADGADSAAPDTGTPSTGVVRELAGMASLAVNLQVRRRHPVSVVQFVTRRCNARCSFCFIDFDHPDPKRLELTLDEIEALTRTFGPHLQNVNLTGGEPFLRSDLTAIAAAYFANAGVRSVYVTTNGSFPDRVERFARDLAPSLGDRKVILSFSVDGFAPEHDRIRRLDGLFDKVLESYHRAASVGGGVMANVAITVSGENHAVVLDLYESLVSEHGVRAVTAVVVRDEGVYEVPADEKVAVRDAYRALTDRIGADLRSGRLEGYDPGSLQGRLMNRKNEILWDLVAETYVEPRFVSTCHAATLFGVIDANGDVHPCEVLDRPLGNLRDHRLDFGALWRSDTTRETARWIRDANCHCSYECAWGFNILGNARYQPKLLGAALTR